MDAQLANDTPVESPQARGLARFLPRPLGLAGFSAIVAAVIILDQITKVLATAAFAGGDVFVIIPRCLQLIHRVNTGAAWSMFRDHPLPLSIFAGLVTLGFAVWSFRLKGAEQAMRWPIGMIIGGAAGNLIDRFRLGHVIDFIDAHWDDVYHFPTFNVADSAICVGMGILILMSFAANPESGTPGSAGTGKAGADGK